jgi:CheY-like chemotaxis protein
MRKNTFDECKNSPAPRVVFNYEIGIPSSLKFNGIIGKRILVIDDELIVGQMVAKALEQTELNVEVCTDPRIALSFIERTYYDLIILDLMMPSMTGFEVIEVINIKRLKHGKIAFLTNISDPKTRTKAKQLGVVGFDCTSHVAISDLQDVVLKHLKYYSLMN